MIKLDEDSLWIDQREWSMTKGLLCNLGSRGNCNN